LGRAYKNVDVKRRDFKRGMKATAEIECFFSIEDDDIHSIPN